MTEFKELMEESNKKGSGAVAGKGYLSRRYDGIAYTLYVPLKNGNGGAFFEILGEDGDLENEKYFVPIMKNGVQLFAFDPKLMRRTEPMLRAFSDFAIPVQFPPLSPFIPYNQEKRLEQYSARRNWKLEPASGWIERAPLNDPHCLEGYKKAVAYAEYLLPDHIRMTIKLCASPRSAGEIVRQFYTTGKDSEKKYPQSGKSYNEPVERDGSYKIEYSTAKIQKILYLASNKGLYSEIEIDAMKGESLKPAWQLLGKLRTDDPELFPQSYE